METNIWTIFYLKSEWVIYYFRDDDDLNGDRRIEDKDLGLWDNINIEIVSRWQDNRCWLWRNDIVWSILRTVPYDFYANFFFLEFIVYIYMQLFNIKYILQHCFAYINNYVC